MGINYLSSYLQFWASSLINDSEWPVLHVALYSRLVEFATNQTFGVKNGVARVDGDLVLGWVTDKTLSICEGNI